MTTAPTFTPPKVRVEPTPRWIRARAGGTTLADSRRAMLLSWYGPGRLPTYVLPADDVRTDLLTPSAQRGDDPVVVPHDVTVDGAVLDGAAQLVRSDEAPLDRLDGWWTFTWDAGVSWFEEDVQAHVHARDPRHRVDALRSSRHVRVELDGVVLAESARPIAVFETSLPTRWYLPAEDVRHDVLVATDTVTACPYKGTARYWSVRLGDAVHPDLAWSYPDPIPACGEVAGHVSFYNERVDILVDGEPELRPITPWSSSSAPRAAST